MTSINKIIFTIALVAPVGFAYANTSTGSRNTTTESGSTFNTNTTTTGTTGTMESDGTTTNSRTPTVTPSSRQTGQTMDSRNSNMNNRRSGQLSRNTITSAQEALSERGYDVRADGISGAQTSRAVRRFQSDNGLPQTGRLDEATLNALSVTIDNESDRLPASTPSGY